MTVLFIVVICGKNFVSLNFFFFVPEVFFLKTHNISGFCLAIACQQLSRNMKYGLDTDVGTKISFLFCWQNVLTVGSGTSLL
jgi:hypothetical protein